MTARSTCALAGRPPQVAPARSEPAKETALFKLRVGAPISSGRVDGCAAQLCWPFGRGWRCRCGAARDALCGLVGAWCLACLSCATCPRSSVQWQHAAGRGSAPVAAMPLHSVCWVCSVRMQTSAPGHAVLSLCLPPPVLFFRRAAFVRQALRQGEGPQVREGPW